jgi:hypothetical protein
VAEWVPPPACHAGLPPTAGYVSETYAFESRPDMSTNILFDLKVTRSFTAHGRTYRLGEYLTVTATPATKLISRGVCRLATKAERDAEYRRLRDEARRNSLRGFTLID